MSGGIGSRLWPLSHEGSPKPFIELNDGQTLIEKTYRRLIGLSQANFSTECITITNANYHELHKRELNKVGLHSTFLLEPFARDTAAAVAMAAHYIKKKFGANAIMLVLPADHLIMNQSAFNAAVKKAFSLAREGFLVSFGIKPMSPNTGFGYIECGEVMPIGKKVVSFTEKPNKDWAEIFLKSGNYLWNSGMYCFVAGLLLDELSNLAPDLSGAVENAFSQLTHCIQTLEGKDSFSIPSDAFELIQGISIDHAVMEGSNKVAVIEADFDWSDIGSWDSIKNLVTPDEFNNRAMGQVFFMDSSNVFVRSEKKSVAAIGVSDLIVVDTPRALLISSLDSAQKVKDAAFALKGAPQNHAVNQGQKVFRPWGSYEVIEEGPGYKVKKIEVIPQASISLQKHVHRNEHWVIVSGRAHVINGDESLTLVKDESVYVRAGNKHRLSNVGEGLLVLIEIQTGSYLGEDDIIRFEDNYGRV